MKQMLKSLLGIVLVVNACTLQAMNNNNSNNNVFGKPYFQGRSQGENLARRLVGNAHELYRCDFDCINGVLSVIPEWNQTFNRNDLGSYFSFRLPASAQANNMSFRGSLAPGATPENTDVRAENFLLASTFDGLVALRPQKQDFIADINFRINLDEWLCGLYFEIDMPVNWTRWNMNLEAPTTDGQRGNIVIAASNPAIAQFEASAPVETIIRAWQGITTRQLDFETASAVAGPNPLNINIEQMSFAVIDGTQSKAGIADLNFILGYNFLCNDCYHFGLNIRGTAPTGTRPEGKLFFEPIVGNGHHATLGAGINGHAILWENGCDQSFSLWFDSAVYHMFNATQTRTFDLRGNGVGSRYLLMKRFTPFTIPNTETQINQFLNTATGQGTFVPGPNVTSIDAKSKINVAGEAVLMFNYQRCGFTFDVGYDIWGRSEEKLTLVGQITNNTFGLLGGTPIDNYDADGTQLPPAQDNPANRTNSTVRINGANASATGDANFPVFVTNANLDIDAAAAPSALSHKVFAHLGYTWEGCDYSPFFGLGGEVEFSAKNNRAFDQWGVWAKGGFAFS